MMAHALLAVLLTHALAHALPRTLPTPFPYPHVSDFEYDYREDVKAQEALLVEATTPPAATMAPSDPLADAREMAKLNIMDRILIALGPPFGEKLPKAPTSDTHATVPTPINITTEPCPYKYKRCSSQTYFPSCDIPRNTAPEVWPQRFNLFFNLSADLDSKLDVINATLRLYKNNSLPLQRAKTLLIKAFVYTRSLTRRRNRTKLVADTQVSSDYLGWVTLSVTELAKRWKKPKNNHGVLITVNDIDNTPWDAPRIFVTMDCAAGLVPLPFEVQTEQEGQQYPALNVRLGSPDDDPDAALSSSPAPSSTSPTAFSSSLPPPSPTMQGDDPATLYEYNHENGLQEEEEEENKEREVGVLEEEGAQVEEEGEEVVEVASARPFPVFYGLHAQARSLDAPQEQLQVKPTTPYFYHHHHHHHLPHPQTSEGNAQHPQTHSTAISRPQEHTTPIPSPTPPTVSLSGPSWKHGALRDMRHRRKNRRHRRG